MIPKYKPGDVVKFKLHDSTQEGTIRAVNVGWTPFTDDEATYNLTSDGSEYHYVSEATIVEKIKWIAPNVI